MVQGNGLTRTSDSYLKQIRNDMASKIRLSDNVATFNELRKPSFINPELKSKNDHSIFLT